MRLCRLTSLALLLLTAGSHADERLTRTAIPALGAAVRTRVDAGALRVCAITIRQQTDPTGEKRLLVDAEVANRAGRPTRARFRVGLFASGNALAQADFGGGDHLVPAGQSATLSAEVPQSGATLPDAFAVEVPPADWYQWRGPQRNGAIVDSPPLADAWPPSGPRKVWEMHGIPVVSGWYAGGNSSPVVAGGRVFIYAHDRNARRDLIVCLDAETGKVVWRREFAGQETWHGGSGSPCVVDGRVYVMAAKTAFCLDADTGDTVWQAETCVMAEHASVAVPGQEISSSFLLVDGVAVIPCGKLLGLDARTGALLWRAPPPGGYADAMTSAVPWYHGGRTYVAYAGQASFCCVDPRTGQVLWQQRGNARGVTYASSPAVDGDLLVTFFRGQLQAHRLAVAGPRLLWQSPFLEEYSSPAVDNGYVYTMGPNQPGKRSTVRCRALETGQVMWDLEVSNPQYTSPLVADGKLVALTDLGRCLLLLDADPKGGRVLARAPVPGLVWSSPVISGGRVFMRLPDGVACYDLTREGNRKRTPGLPQPPARVAEQVSVVRVDSEQPGNEGSLAIDGLEATTWHTHWSGGDAPPFPHEIVLDLGKRMEIEGITLLPRQDYPNGYLAEAEVYLSDNLDAWGEPAARFTSAPGKDRRLVRFARRVSGRYLRLVALKGPGQERVFAVAELDVLMPGRPSPNLLTYGGFEDVADGRPAGWSPPAFPGPKAALAASEQDPKDGRFCLSLKGAGRVSATAGQTFALEPGRTYTLAGYARAPAGRALLRLDFFRGEHLLGQVESRPVSGKAWRGVAVSGSGAGFPQADRVGVAVVGSGGPFAVAFDSLTLSVE